MSNRSSSHKHCLTSIHILRKKSTLSKRRNKSLCNERRIERHEVIDKNYQEALAKIS